MWNESPLTTIQIRQGPFARPALPGVLTTTNPSDSRSQTNHSYLFPWPVVPAVHTLVTPRRVSQVPWLVCQRPPPPTTPESPTAAVAHCYAVDTRLRHLWQVGHSQQRNEAESGSLALRLTPSSHGASAAGSPRHPPDRLHGERAITMISSFQLTRPARLCLAHQMSADEINEFIPLFESQVRIPPICVHLRPSADKFCLVCGLSPRPP